MGKSKQEIKEDRIKLSVDQMSDEERKYASDYLLGIMSFKEHEEKHRREKASRIVPMENYLERAIERIQKWDGIQGYSTGFKELDRITGGLVGGEMIVVAGRTSVGKSRLALNIAANVVQERPVLYITLENSKEEVASRLVSILKGTVSLPNTKMFLTGETPLPDKLLTASLQLFFNDQDELEWQDIDAIIGNFVEQNGKGLVVIDHLHYFNRAQTASDATNLISNLTKEIKKNAIRHDVPVILVSHVSRGEKGTKVRTDSLKGSSSIEQDADIVLMIEGNDENTDIQVYQDKNRNRKDWKGGKGTARNTAIYRTDGIALFELLNNH